MVASAAACTPHATTQQPGSTPVESGYAPTAWRFYWSRISMVAIAAKTEGRQPHSTALEPRMWKWFTLKNRNNNDNNNKHSNNIKSNNKSNSDSNMNDIINKIS